MMVCNTKRLSWTKRWLPQLKMASMCLSLQASLSFQAASENWLNADCRKEIRASTCLICWCTVLLPMASNFQSVYKLKRWKTTPSRDDEHTQLVRKETGVGVYQMRVESEVLFYDWRSPVSFLPRWCSFVSMLLRLRQRVQVPVIVMGDLNWNGLLKKCCLPDLWVCRKDVPVPCQLLKRI